jgi:hypothetical protein
MSTPTDYNLTYTDPCDEEPGCGEGSCLGKIKFMPRPQNFCEDVTLQKDCTILGDLTVVPARISVGGQTFTPTVINTISGPHLVLAVY